MEPLELRLQNQNDLLTVSEAKTKKMNYLVMYLINFIIMITIQTIIQIIIK